MTPPPVPPAVLEEVIDRYAAVIRNLEIAMQTVRPYIPDSCRDYLDDARLNARAQLVATRDSVRAARKDQGE